MANSTMDRGEASKQLSDARRSYAVAELIQERRRPGNIDSSVSAHRALSLSLKLILRLHGDAVPDEFPALAARACAVALEQNLLAEDLTADLLVVDEMRRRVVAGDAEQSGAEDRKYDRAMLRCAECIAAAESYADERFPADPVKRKRTSWYVAGLVFTFVAGVVIGHHVHLDAPLVATKSDPQPAAESVRKGLDEPGQMRPLNLPARLLLTDPHVVCDGCWPVEGSVAVPFAWTSGKVEFVVSGLVPLKKYALTIGVLDFGRVTSVRFQAPFGKQSEEVHAGAGALTAPSPFTADADGKLRVTMLLAAWRPSEQNPGSTDTRELGVAVGDLRIEDATAQPLQAK